MKCAQCGMPLSPSRTQCPRCGVLVGKSSGRIRLTRDSSPPPSPAIVHTDIDTISKTPPVWPTNKPPVTPSGETPPEQEAFPIPVGSFFPSAASFTTPQPDETAQAQHQDYVSGIPTSTPIASPVPFQMPAPQLRPTYPPRTVSPRQPKARLGFTIAGMCFITGIIIMVFVFVMAQGLQTSNITANIPATPQSSIASLPTQTPVSPTTPTSVQATPTLTSNQYINNVNLASSINPSTGQALQLATEFHTNQNIYVTMTIQQLAYTGAVCLEWSINNQVYPYATLATPGGATYLTQTNAYFYYRPGTIGTGTVSISWASSTACTDKVLIQSLPFSVIA